MPEPNWRAELRERLTPLRLTPVREADIIEELAVHLGDRYREHLASGYAAPDAARLALAELDADNVLASRLARVESTAPVDASIIAMPASREGLMRSVWQDVRYGLRSLRSSPGFAVAALVMLALGTGANAAMFSVLDAVLGHPTFPDQARIVMLTDRRYKPGVAALIAPPEEVRQLQEMTEVFSRVGAFGLAQPILTDAGVPRRLLVECVSASMFQVLGIQPAIGRSFRDDEDAPGSPPVLVIGDRLWHQAFNGGRDAVGRSLTLNGHPVTVVGVFSSDFEGTRAITVPDAWAPIGQGREQPSFTGCQTSARGSNVYARIRPDLTLVTANDRLRALTADTRGLESWGDSTVGNDRTTLLVLAGAVLIVLLIVCVNVANLLLMRAVRRRREIATRLALGASARRLLRQLLTESVLLATLGAVGGLVVARLVLGTIVDLVPRTMPHIGRITLNGRVLAMTIGAGALAGLLAGIVPAVQSTSEGLAGLLYDAQAVTRRHRGWAPRVLVVSEVALSVALLVGAMLMVRTFVALRPTHPGFDPSHKIVANLSLSGPRYQSDASRLAFIAEWTDRLARLPGVLGVTAVNYPPFANFVSNFPIAVTGRPDTNDQHINAFASMVAVNYFDEMRIALVRGREFLPVDRAGDRPVAIVNETLAHRAWPDTNPLGQTIAIRNQYYDAAPRSVVGVVRDVQLQGWPRASNELYLPIAQEPAPAVTLIARAPNAGAEFGADVRRQAAALDPTQVVDSVRPFEDILGQSVAFARFVTWLMTAFAILAVGLALIGVTTVVGGSVAQRTREIGIRMALGARPRSVVRLVLFHALSLAGGGVIVGVGLAILTTRFLASWLYGVTPLDRPTFVASAVLMMLATAAASYLPAKRAMGVDPLAALRTE